MILLRPFVVFLGAVLLISQIPLLQMIGLAIIVFTYHMMLRNRNIHMKKMKELYDTKGWEFPVKINKGTYIWLMNYVVSLSVLVFSVGYVWVKYGIRPDMTSEQVINKLSTLDIPITFTLVCYAALIMIFVSYIKVINRIIKDQFLLQESQIKNGLLKEKYLKYRNGFMVMALRIITLNFYEYYLLFLFTRESTMYYISGGTTIDYKNIVEKVKTEIETKTEITNEIIETTEQVNPEEELKLQQNQFEIVYKSVIESIKELSGNEKFSKIFSLITTMKKDFAVQILEKLLNDNIISNEQYTKLLSFI